MIRKPIPQSWRVGLGVASFLLLIGAYSYLSHRQLEENPDDRSIPSWSRLWSDGVVRVFTPNEHTGEVWIWQDFQATFRERLLAGMLVGVGVSLLVGLLMGCYDPLEAFFLPPLAFLAKIPPVAMLAVFFVLVGSGFEMYVTMIAFGIVPVLAQSIYHAAKDDVPDELLHKAYTLGASQMESIYNVIYKQTLPRIIDGVRLQVGPAMVYLIAAEWIAADVGFGYHLRLQSRLLDMSVVYVYLIVLGAVGFFLDFVLTRLRLWLCPWYGH